MLKIHILKIFFIYLIAFPPLLNAQPGRQVIASDTVDATHFVYSRFSEIRIAFGDSLQITFDTITEQQFNAFKQNYASGIDTGSYRISRGENSFQLTAADTAFIFRCANWKLCYYYHGYYPDLDSYLIGVTGNEIYETFLIDRVTAKGLPVPPLYDAASFNPIISPNKKYMLIYNTCGDPSSIKYFGDLSAIALLDISDMDQLYDLNLRAFKVFATQEWIIDDLVWIDNQRIALKIYEDMKRDEQRQYYKKGLLYFIGNIQ